MQAKLRLCLCALLLFVCGNVFESRAQTDPNGPQRNPALEKWIRQQVANNVDAYPGQVFPDESKRTIGSAFLIELLENPPATPTGPATKILISDVTVIGVLNATFLEVPYELILLKCHFLDHVSFSESNFKRDFSLAGSTFDKSVSARGTMVGGSFNLEDCHFNKDSSDPAQFVDFEYMRIGRNLAIENAEFRGNVSFLRSDVGKIFGAEYAKFLNPGAEAKFEGIEVDGEFQIRGAQIDSTANFRSAKTGGFDADGTHFNNFANLYDMTINGNAKFERAHFLSTLTLARTTVAGNLVLINVEAKSSMGKDFSVLKTDNLIFRNNVVAPPYSLNGLSYRLLFAQNDEILSFVDGANFDVNYSDTYKNLESYYLQRENVAAAKAVHVAWKKRESDRLGPCTLCFNRNSRLLAHPVKYLLNWAYYLTTGYGQYKELALVWSIGFIVAGYFVFRRREWMEPMDAPGSEDTWVRYHPLWYSIALFLPIVNLLDKDNWIPKADRRKSRIYMRFHIIFGYLLIPVGLAAWTGLIR